LRLAGRCVSAKSRGVLSGHAVVRDAPGSLRRHRFRSRFHAGGAAAAQATGIHGDQSMTGFKNLCELKGRTAVLTGGCGILGQRFADGLAEFGANVALLDLDEQALQKAAAEISPRHGARVKGYACDITQPEAIRNVAKAIEADLGQVSILLNN